MLNIARGEGLMHDFVTHIRFAALAGSSALALVSAPALAQDFEQEGSEPASEAPSDNVIVVTATKREQTLQETPISVSVTSGETLEQAQIRDILDLQTVAPSLRVSQLQTSSASTFIIRGFGNGANNFGIEPSVGVFIDGVFRSRTAGALNDLANVQRIEVLRGPQSTLFGKNASAGVISIVTREPQFDFGGTVEASYGNFDAMILRGDVTGPISDTLAFSVDANYNRRDGYAEIVNLGIDASDRNRWQTRGQLLWEPTPDLRVRAIADYGRVDEICCAVGNVVAGPTTAALPLVGGAIDPGNLFSYDIFLNRAPVTETDNYGGSVQVDWATGPLSITSITSYRELKNFFDQDVDFTSADVLSNTVDQSVKTFTQEFRVASDFDGPINFLLGGYYFDETIDEASGLTTGTAGRPFFELLAQFATGDPTFSFNAIESALGLQQNSIFAAGPLTDEAFGMTNESYSIFGTVDFEPVDGLLFTAGFNYTDDQKEFQIQKTAFDPLANLNLVDAFITIASGGTVTTRDQFLALPAANQAALAALATDPAQNPFLGLAGLQFQPPFLAVPNGVEDNSTSDSDFTYTLRIAYDVSPNLNAYVSYATGFKASSVNLSRDSRPALGDFTPGPGNSTFLAPSSPVLDAGLALPNLGVGSRIAGPEEAKVWEIGLKGQWQGFAFNLALFDQTLDGFQDFLFTGTGFQLSNAGRRSAQGFEFDTNINPTDGLVFTFAATYIDDLFDSFVESPVGDLSGQSPAGPDWTITTSATYTHEFGASGNRLISRLDYSHEASDAIARGGLPTFGPDAERFTTEVNLVNGSITLALDNGLEVGIWGRNILNDQYILTIFDSVAQAGSISGYPSVPRTYGGVVRFKF